jgi:hypothetical protein
MPAALLDWWGSVAGEADDKTGAISRHHGFAPADYRPGMGLTCVTFAAANGQ